jgi:hypothetical protein
MNFLCFFLKGRFFYNIAIQVKRIGSKSINCSFPICSNPDLLSAVITSFLSRFINYPIFTSMSNETREFTAFPFDPGGRIFYVFLSNLLTKPIDLIYDNAYQYTRNL